MSDDLAIVVVTLVEHPMLHGPYESQKVAGPSQLDHKIERAIHHAVVHLLSPRCWLVGQVLDLDSVERIRTVVLVSDGVCPILVRLHQDHPLTVVPAYVTGWSQFLPELIVCGFHTTHQFQASHQTCHFVTLLSFCQSQNYK